MVSELLEILRSWIFGIIWNFIAYISPFWDISKNNVIRKILNEIITKVWVLLQTCEIYRFSNVSHQEMCELIAEIYCKFFISFWRTRNGNGDWLRKSRQSFFRKLFGMNEEFTSITYKPIDSNERLKTVNHLLLPLVNFKKESCKI